MNIKETDKERILNHHAGSTVISLFIFIGLAVIFKSWLPILLILPKIGHHSDLRRLLDR